LPNWLGIHNNRPEVDFVDDGFIALGWDAIDRDVRDLVADRDALKAELHVAYPRKNSRAVAAWAGIFIRFVIDARPGDVVVHPHKEERTINFGRIESDYRYVADGPTRRHRRAVTWTGTGVPRDALTQGALWEIGSTLTFFAIRNHVDELERFA
jgi:predicted Mrr-cat superfamily restriction endonuclease